MALQDDDNLIIGRGTTSYKISYGELKEDIGTGGGGGGALSQTGVSIIATPPDQVPTQLLAQGGIGLGPSGIIDPPDWSWYKDDVLIPGATTDTLDVTDPGTYKAVATVVDPTLPEGENTSTKERSIGPLYGAVSMTELLVATTGDTAPSTVTLRSQWTGPTDTTNSSGKPSGGGDDWQVPEYRLLIDGAVVIDWSTDIPSYDVLDTITDDVKLTFYKRSLDNASGNYAEATKDQIIKAPVTGPDATMHGLRFDKQRETYLSSSLNLDKPWTISVWVKLTSLDPSIVIGSNGSNVIYWDGSNWRVTEAVIPGSTAKLNTWQHIVATGDGTHVNLWLDGLKSSTGDGVSAPRSLLQEDMWIGANHIDGVLTNVLIPNGYLSDVYVVEQEFDNPAETFGKFFEGKWGPLDSSVVKSKITSGPNYAEKWSDNLTCDTGFTAEADKAFDGDPTSGGAVSVSTNSTITFTTTAFATGKHTIGVLCDVKQQVKIDNVPAINPGSALTSETVEHTLTVEDGFSTITITSAGFKADLNSIKVNGRILIDGPADNSQVWSNLTTVSAPLKYGTIQDAYTGASGNTGPYFEAVDAEFELKANLGRPTSLIINMTAGGAASNVDVVINDNTPGTNYSLWNGTAANSTDAPVDVSANIPAGVDITSLKIVNKNAGVRVCSITVDGKILIDGESFGANGFFLPFDPAATGGYSKNTSGTVNYVNPGNAFNGSLLTWCTGPTPKGTPGEFTFNFNPALSGKIEVYGSSGSDSAVGGDQIILSDGSIWDLTSVGVSSKQWHNFGTKSNITSITLKTTSTSTSAGVDFAAVRVNGKILVDHNSIGVDASGNENNFHDQNFAVGNTIWSNGVSPVGVTIIGSKTGAYDGDLTTRCGLTGGLSPSSYIDFNFGQTFTNKTLRVYANLGNLGNGELVAGGQTKPLSNDTVLRWIDFGSLASFDGVRAQLTSAETNGIYVHAIEVGGELLIDGNIADTVTDTPMRNYAVLEGGSDVTLSNGNLQVTNTTSGGQRLSFSNMSVGLTDKVYAEYTAQYTNGEMLMGVSRSTTQGGSLGSPSDQWAYRNDTGSILNNGSYTAYGATWGEGDIIGVLVDNTGTGSTTTTVKFFVNGVDQGVALSGSTARAWYFGAGNNTQTYSWNFGQQPFAASNVTHNQAAGTVEIDGETYGTLYQTWEQWARTALGYAVDRIAKLEQRNVQLEALVAEARTRLAALELNEVSDDAVDTALITLIGNINDRLTVLEGGN